MKYLKQIRVVGLGGQGAVLAGTILGRAAVSEGKWASGANSYGSQARGGVAGSEIVVSTQPIKFPRVINSDILIALSQSAYDQYIPSVKDKGAIVVYDDFSVVPQDKDDIDQIAVPAVETAIAELKSKQTANIVILAAATAITEIVGQKSLLEAVKETVSEKHRELNLKSVELGWKMGRTVSKTKTF